MKIITLLIASLAVFTQSYASENKFCDEIKKEIISYHSSDNTTDVDECAKQVIQIEDTTITIEICEKSTGPKKIDAGELVKLFDIMDDVCDE